MYTLAVCFLLIAVVAVTRIGLFIYNAIKFGSDIVGFKQSLVFFIGIFNFGKL
jgi:hypothetical protein